jgi:2,4-dienoyl-CoA reductase-like NADH-dependent reductase (Old Yellow Enzyme family)
MRFPLEVFEVVREAFPADRPVGVKVSAVDWMPGGWDLAQTIEFSKELKKRGVDWITTSSAGISPLQKIPVAPGYQLPFAQRVREATGATIMAVGLITEAGQAEAIIASGQADLVALARGIRPPLGVACGSAARRERRRASTVLLARAAAGARRTVQRDTI